MLHELSERTPSVVTHDIVVKIVKRFFRLFRAIDRQRQRANYGAVEGKYPVKNIDQIFLFMPGDAKIDGRQSSDLVDGNHSTQLEHKQCDIDFLTVLSKPASAPRHNTATLTGQA